MNNDKFCYSLNSYDYYTEPTIEKCLEELLNNFRFEFGIKNLLEDIKGKYFIAYIGTPIYYEDDIPVEEFIEILNEQAVDNCCEDFADDYLMDLTKEEIKELKERMSEMWLAFKKKHNIQAPFFEVENSKKYKIYVNVDEIENKIKFIKYEEC